MSTKTITFQRLDAANFDDLSAGLAALAEGVGDQRRESSYWRWRYLHAPAGPGGTIVAISDGQVVGKFGNVHRRFVVGGRRVLVGLQEGLSVLPAARSWRCYQGLAARSYS